MNHKELLNIIKTRRSIRKFKPYHISNEEIDTILEAGRWAPSARNKQPWEFVIIKNIQNIIRASETFGTFKPNELKNSACIIGIVKTSSNQHAYTDIGLAMQNIILQAHAMGFGTCIIGAFEKEPVSNLLNVPADKELCYIIPIGKPAESPTKTRKELSKIIHLENYETG